MIDQLPEPELMRVIQRPADTLKAYRATTSEEDCSVVVIAHTRDEAEHIACNTLNDSDLTIARDPQYDHYAFQGFVPVSRLLQDGWWYSCFYCGDRVQKDEWDDAGRTYVAGDHEVFCDAEHEAAHHEQARARLEKRTKAEAEAARRWKGVQVVSWYPGMDDAPGHLVLELPTLTRQTIGWTPFTDEMRGADDDKEAFMTWAIRTTWDEL